MNKIKLFAPAKVNLYLDIISRRKDGYHNIITFFHKIRLFDIIWIKEIPKGIVIKCRQDGVPENKDNLAYKAVKMLEQATERQFNVAIRIVKRIPVSAGLGGGSSDAAAVLLGLNKLYKLNLSRPKLMKIAVRLGADVPFFVSNYTSAVGKGIGERLTPVKSRAKYWFVIVVPPKKVKTKKIYSLIKHILTKSEANVKLMAHAFNNIDINPLGASLYNALEPITMKLCKEVCSIKQTLAGLGCRATLMSGSGASVFALTTTRGEAQAIKQKIYGKNWNTYVAKSL